MDQGWLVPPSLHEFVSAGHVAHFIRDTVRKGFDPSAILNEYKEPRGYPPYHAGTLVAEARRRMRQAEASLDAEVRRWLKRASNADVAEDREHGAETSPRLGRNAVSAVLSPRLGRNSTA